MTFTVAEDDPQDAIDFPDSRCQHVQCDEACRVSSHLAVSCHVLHESGLRLPHLSLNINIQECPTYRAFGDACPTRPIYFASSLLEKKPMYLSTDTCIHMRMYIHIYIYVH